MTTDRLAGRRSTHSGKDRLTVATGPYDEHGELLHEDDPAAQLLLALVRLEDELAGRGLGLGDVAALRIDAVRGAGVADVQDVLLEALDRATPPPVIGLVEVADLGVPGMLVGLRAVCDAPLGPSTHPLPEGTVMTSLLPTLDAPTVASLTAACEVHVPGDPGYDAARTPWNLAVAQRPAAVAVPRSVEEVVAVVRAATDAGLRIAPQSTGHGAAALGEQRLDDVVLLRMHALTGVTVDAGQRIARVVGGTLWRDVVAAAAPHGLTALHGSAGDVAVAGYVLGGGLSFYARSKGLAARSVRAVELVTADGQLVRATADDDPDLFWAVRGGGGSFGVVVAIELELLEVPVVYGGMLLWDAERAPEVLPAWLAWTREAPESATTSFRVMQFPPLPELPPFLSGRRVVVIDGAVLEGEADAARLLAPLRALAPEVDTFGVMPAAGMLEVHMDPPGPVPAVSDHAVLWTMTDEAADALLDQFAPGTPLMFAELRHLGGALAERAAGGGALDHLPGAYAMLAVAPAPTPEMADAGALAAATLVEALRPWSMPTTFLNFADRTVSVPTAYGEWERLRSVRRSVDPHGVWVANHPISV